MPLNTRVYNLGPAARIPLGEGRTFQIGAIAIAVFRTRKDEVFATQASCSHLEAPLADGMVGGGKVICPLHVCRFDLATGQPENLGCKPLKTYPVFVGNTGNILLRLNDTQSKTDLAFETESVW